MPGPKDVDKKDVRHAAEAIRGSFHDDAIRNLSEMVYRLRLESGDLGERMVKDDEDAGEKLRSRAGQYDSLTRDYLKALTLLGYDVVSG